MCIGGSAVADYRIYELDRNGHIVSGCDITCEDDEEACRFVLEMLEPGSQAEIWNFGRRVGVVVRPGIAQPWQ